MSGKNVMLHPLDVCGVTEEQFQLIKAKGSRADSLSVMTVVEEVETTKSNRKGHVYTITGEQLGKVQQFAFKQDSYSLAQATIDIASKVTKKYKAPKTNPVVE